jgi:predicted SAM-dependent methyltransferase
MPAGARGTDDCLCGSAASQVLARLTERARAVRCLDCGLTRTWPTPSADALRDAYAARGPLAGGTATHGHGWRRVWRVPDLPSGARVVELGAGSGRFAEWARQTRGWAVTTVDGVGAAESCGQDAWAITWAGTVDLIAAWQVLEHTLDPIHVLDTAYWLLRPGGTLALSVPNLASLERRVFGPRWYAWQPDVHLWHFTPRTLRALVARAGFTVVRVWHQRGWRRHGGRLADALGVVTAALRCSGRITLTARRPGGLP